MSCLSPIVSVMHTYLEAHPEAYPGGTKAASIRHVGISSPGDRVVMQRVSGKLDVREKASLALELAQAPNSALQSQFGSSRQTCSCKSRLALTSSPSKALENQH